MTLDSGRIAIILLLGFALGLGASRWQHHRRMDPEVRYARMLQKFQTKLGLSPDQRREVEKIFAAKRAKVKALHEDVRPRFEEIHKSARDEVRALLTPAQQAEFDRLEAKRAARRAKEKARWGGH